jgi:hypothetical protein
MKRNLVFGPWTTVTELVGGFTQPRYLATYTLSERTYDVGASVCTAFLG